MWLLKTTPEGFDLSLKWNIKKTSKLITQKYKYTYIYIYNVCDSLTSRHKMTLDQLICL